MSIKVGGKPPEKLLTDGAVNTKLIDINKKLKERGFVLKYYGYSLETTELIYEFVALNNYVKKPNPKYLRVYSIGDITVEEVLKTLRYCLKDDDKRS